MAVIQARTREQLRNDVGRLLDMNFRVLEADATGLTTTFITDDIPEGGNNEHNGKWLVFTSGINNDGLIRRVETSTISDTSAPNRVTLLFSPAVTDATANGDTAELWDENHNPTGIQDFINQSIFDATGAVYDDVEDTTLHAGSQTRFDIPSGISMLQKVQYRSKVTNVEVIAAQAYDEAVDSDFTVTLDTIDLLYGRQATKFVIAGTVSAGDLASDDIASLDLSPYSHIEFPIKVVTTVASDDLRLILSSSASGASETEAIVIPAITALTDTWVRVALANPESDTAIISVALEYNANGAANTVWVGQVIATRADSATWADLPRHLWSIDRSARDLVFHPGADSLAGYRLLKLIGGDKPALLSADGTSNEIADTYVIRHTTALALLSGGGGPNTDQKENFKRGQWWAAWAEKAKQQFPTLVDIRLVE